MRKYIDYIVIGIKEHMVYPSAIWAKLFSKIIYLYLQFSIWTALFSSHSQINPLINREDTLKYIIVATIISAFIECNTIEWINAQIQTGNIIMELIRPIDYIKINRHSPYLSITLHKCYPYYLFGISTFPNLAYHSIALRKFSITIV